MYITSTILKPSSWTKREGYDSALTAVTITALQHCFAQYCDCDVQCSVIVIVGTLYATRMRTSTKTAAEILTSIFFSFSYRLYNSFVLFNFA